MTQPTTHECDLPPNWTTASVTADEIAFARSDVALTLLARRIAFEPDSRNLPEEHVWKVVVEVDLGEDERRKFVASLFRRSDAIRALFASVEQVEGLLADPSSRVTATSVAEHVDVRNGDVTDPDAREPPS